MAIIDRQFLNANEGRNYPISDVATRVADDGSVLSNSFLVDAYIRVPYVAYKRIYVSAASVGPGIVSVVFSAHDNPDIVPLGAVTVAKPVTPYKNYAIDPLVDGVGGWVMFGQDSRGDDEFNLKFSSADQTQLLDRCVNVFDVVPVSGIRKKYATDSLTGLVRLSGRIGSVQTVKGQRTINGVVKDVALIRVVSADSLVDKLHDLAGVCGHRPSELTCNKRVITAINDVTPDCDGNLDLEFTNGIVVGAVEHGLVLDYMKGMAAACVKIDPDKLPSETEDICDPSDEPIPPEPSESSYAPSSLKPDDPEYCETFDIDPDELAVASGGFVIDAGRWKSTGASANNFAKNYKRTFFGNLYKYALKCTVRPSAGGEGHLCFDVNSDSSGSNIYKFFGLAVDGYGSTPAMKAYANKFFLGTYNSLTADSSAKLGYFHRVTTVIDPGMTLNADEDYDLYLYVEEFDTPSRYIRITYDIVWSGGYLHGNVTQNLGTAGSYLYQPGACVGGLGALTPNTYFDFFGANCESSSSLTP